MELSNHLQLVRKVQGHSKLSHVELEERIRDHEAVIMDYLRSRKIRGHTKETVTRSKATLERFFTSTGKLFWDVGVYDVREYIEALEDIGLARITRYGYVKEIELFYRYVLDHPWVPPSEVDIKMGQELISLEIKYGVRLTQPVDRWILPPLPADDFDAHQLPTREQLREFFGYLRDEMSDTQKPMALARDYAIYRLFYGSGVRGNELVHLDLKDVRFDYGTICVRFGKGSKGKGYKPRWVPMWNGLEGVLRTYLSKVRPRFAYSDDSPALFLAEGGNRISMRTIRQRLGESLADAKAAGVDIFKFNVHDFRRMFATHAYEEQPERLRVLQEVLGHSFATTTQRYLRPSRHYFEVAFNDLTTDKMKRLR